MDYTRMVQINAPSKYDAVAKLKRWGYELETDYDIIPHSNEWF